MKIKLLFQFLSVVVPVLACFSDETPSTSPSLLEEYPLTSTKQLPLPHKMLYRAHPWHGPALGERAPEIVNCYIEMAPVCTLKFEMDKETGILKVDRPQKYSSFCPTLYGFLPRTYAGSRIGEYTSLKTGIPGIGGDKDALDVFVLSDNTFLNGDILLRARPIGGFRVLDSNEADDKIIAVLVDDAVFGNIKDLHECPEKVIDQMRHFLLTYKDLPEKDKKGKIEIHSLYGREEAYEVIRRGYLDYMDYISLYQQ